MVARSGALLLFCAVVFSAGAQQPGSSPSPSPRLPSARQPLWRCELPGGVYTVALNAVISVSKHEYTVDNAARVTEVNLDTAGTLAVRFYFLESNLPGSPLGIGQSTIDKAQELIREGTDRAGQSDMWRKVLKTYPATTHAKTVEFRLESKEELNQIFESADASFRTGRPATVKIQ
jgi:hypothetical protein